MPIYTDSINLLQTLLDRDRKIQALEQVIDSHSTNYAKLKHENVILKELLMDYIKQDLGGTY